MTSPKTMIVMGVALAAVAMISGCGRGPVKTPDQSSAQVPTEWNDTPTQLSPFTKVRFDGDNVIVTYAGSEYSLVSVNDLSTSEILDFCRNQYGDSMQKKRFAEDLVAVLAEMGHPINSDHTVSLALTDPATGEIKKVEHAAATEANRKLVRESLALVENGQPAN